MAQPGRYLIPALVAVLLGGSVRPVLAQSVPVVDVKLTVFAMRLPQRIKYVPEKGNDPVELTFFSSQRSKVYEYYGANPIEFFAEVRVAPDPARPRVMRTDRVTVARAVIPPGVRDAFLLFTVEPGWEKQPIPRYVVQVFDDGPSAFPPGHLVFLNATGAPFFGTVAGREVQAPVGLSRIFNVGRGETPVSLQVHHEGKILPVYNERIGLGTNQRVTVLLLPPYRSDILQIQRRLLYDPDRPPDIDRPMPREG